MRMPIAVFDSLTAEKISADLEEILDEATRRVELETHWRGVPKGSPIEIVYRSYHACEFPVGFQDHFRVLVALGGVKEVFNGAIVPEICFARMIYNIDGKLVTADFTSNL